MCVVGISVQISQGGGGLGGGALGVVGRVDEGVEVKVEVALEVVGRVDEAMEEGELMNELHEFMPPKMFPPINAVPN
ncbi:hypothetical protein CYMTET_35090 [Cymbomonas tetramitiformis]|uniref:Uncharacterized protein n=1 Tax=Cymbomonas tetramitiformis TaxID=36881 RepID=A0AAE0KPJ4_9CHLO|nr:hypothetical protein CYMTET_35090 [Cymbomonas tetramitiformis]